MDMRDAEALKKASLCGGGGVLHMTVVDDMATGMKAKQTPLGIFLTSPIWADLNTTIIYDSTRKPE